MFLIPARQHLSLCETVVPFDGRQRASIMMRHNSSRLRLPNDTDYEAFRGAPLIKFNDAPRRAGVIPARAAIAVVVTLSILTAFWLVFSYFRPY